MLQDQAEPSNASCSTFKAATLRVHRPYPGKRVVAVRVARYSDGAEIQNCESEASFRYRGERLLAEDRTHPILKYIEAIAEMNTACQNEKLSQKKQQARSQI